MSKKIVILGGGVGGIICANKLAYKLGKKHKIVLIEKNSHHTFAPSFPWLMIGERKPDEITRPLRSLVHRDVEIVFAEVEGIEIQNRKVITTKNSLTYDYLVVALGAELSYESIQGLKDAHTFYSFDGAKKLKEALERFDGGKIVIVVCSVPYKCPGAPHEGAMLISDYFKRRGIRNKVEIHLYTPEPQPMPVAGPNLGSAVKQMLEERGIAFHSLHKLLAVDSDNKKLIFESKEPVSYDLLITIPPHNPPRVVMESGLAGKDGWIPVEPTTLKTEYENIYAIGDITSIPIPGRWKQDIPLKLPKAGVFAHLQAEVVADRIADEINGQKPQTNFNGFGYCILEAGEGIAGLAFGNFFAEPSPEVQMRPFGRSWHLGRVIFEKWFLARPGINKIFYSLLLKIGSKLFRVPISV
jgi:sulfide:quinone oxidoreductase